MAQKFYTADMTRLIALAVLSYLALPFCSAAAQDQPAPALSLAPGAVVVPDMVAPEPSARAIVQTGLSDAPPTPARADAPFDPEITDVPVPQKTDADVTVMKDPYAETYVKGTPGNLSKLYWRLRVFDLGDDTAVDNYMLINECDLYQRYINDDFEWTKLRNAARGMLEKERDKFTNSFMFILPVKLGRYDTERGGFHLVENSHFDTVRRMEITGNSLARQICGRTGEIKDYPRNLMLILKQPFTYNFAKVDEHVAQAYIIRKQKEVLDLTYDVRQNRYSRVAYVRMRVSLNEYQGNVKGQDGSVLSILYGDLEGIDMFEDPYGKMLLSMDGLKPEASVSPAGAAPAESTPSDLGDGVKDVTVPAPAPSAQDSPPPHADEAPTLKETMDANPPSDVKVRIGEQPPADTPLDAVVPTPEDIDELSPEAGAPDVMPDQTQHYDF